MCYLEQAIYKDSSRWTVVRSQGDGGSKILLNGCWLFVLHYKMFRDRKHGIVGLSTAEPPKMIHLLSLILGSLEHN